MLKFTFLLQHHVRHRLPYAPLIFTHVVESLVFVPIMVRYGDKLEWLTQFFPYCLVNANLFHYSSSCRSISRDHRCASLLVHWCCAPEAALSYFSDVGYYVHQYITPHLALL